MIGCALCVLRSFKYLITTHRPYSALFENRASLLSMFLCQSCFLPIYVSTYVNRASFLFMFLCQSCFLSIYVSMSIVLTFYLCFYVNCAYFLSMFFQRNFFKIKVKCDRSWCAVNWMHYSKARLCYFNQCTSCMVIDRKMWQ